MHKKQCTSPRVRCIELRVPGSYFLVLADTSVHARATQFIVAPCFPIAVRCVDTHKTSRLAGRIRRPAMTKLTAILVLIVSFLFVAPVIESGTPSSVPCSRRWATPATAAAPTGRPAPSRDPIEPPAHPGAEQRPGGYHGVRYGRCWRSGVPPGGPGDRVGDASSVPVFQAVGNACDGRRRRLVADARSGCVWPVGPAPAQSMAGLLAGPAPAGSRASSGRGPGAARRPEGRSLSAAARP